ncbi:MAG: hypothetical protein HQL82_02485 [Magnetococcales bacterium]|nr:hypothetical protein [Magnetococcales bacterium]
MIPDFINLLFVLLYVVLILRWAQAKRIVYFLFGIHLLLPFVIVASMPNAWMTDLDVYLKISSHIRELFAHHLGLIREAPVLPSEEASFMNQRQIVLGAGLFAMAPIPFLNSHISTGLISVLVYGVIYLFLKTNRMLEGAALWFYMFFPSLLFYTSVGLRDVFVLLFMFVMAAWFSRGRHVAGAMASIPLIALKPFNFILIWVAILLYLGCSSQSRSWRRLDVLGGAVLIVGGLMIVSHHFRNEWANYLSLDYLNWLIEVLNMNSFQQAPLFAGWMDVLKYIPLSGVHFFVKPLPWEAEKAVHVIQSLENLLVLVLIAGVWWTSKKRRELLRSTLFLNLLLVTGMVGYGILVANFGTAARYRFPFVAVYVTLLLANHSQRRICQGNPIHALSRKKHLSIHNRQEIQLPCSEP